MAAEEREAKTEELDRSGGVGGGTRGTREEQEIEDEVGEVMEEDAEEGKGATEALTVTEIVPRYSLFTECLDKLRERFDSQPQRPDIQACILVMTGAFNPVWAGHIDAMEAAASYCNSVLGHQVIGGVLSPSHDTAVRNKLKRTPKEIVPPRHRLRMLQEMASHYTWVTVDKWEVTRRASMDYLSVLDHVRAVTSDAFPELGDIQVYYVCDGSDMIRASPVALKEQGFKCISTARPEDIDKTVRAIGRQVPSWDGIGLVVENAKIVPHDMVGLSSLVVRKTLKGEGKPKSKQEYQRALTSMLTPDVARYVVHEKIGLKMADREPWSKQDQCWAQAESEWMAVTYQMEDDMEAQSCNPSATMKMANYDRK